MKHTDQLGRTITLGHFPPQRIVSLVPSQTELLADLGLEAQVVGVTKFCVHPAHWRKQKTIIGGTKQLQLDRIRALRPDLIIANKEENDKEQVEALAELFPVWVSKVVDLPSALAMIEQVGGVCHKSEVASEWVKKIQYSFAQLQEMPKRSAAYLIWRKPYMASGGDTFIHAMLQKAGFDNVFGQQKRYPQLSLADLQAAKPEVILLSSEPFPFKEKHLIELQEHCPQAVIKLVDGELFSWYGSRLLHSASYFFNLRQLI